VDVVAIVDVLVVPVKKKARALRAILAVNNQYVAAKLKKGLRENVALFLVQNFNLYQRCDFLSGNCQKIIRFEMSGFPTF
jgi:hypothetical protein